MQVVDLPDEKPRITGIKEKYQIGETMEALCTSWQSHPPANLTWFINEEKVELQEASPRLGRVMGVGQEPGGDAVEDTDSVNNDISVSDGLKSDKKGEAKSQNENTGIEPWPAVSNSNVIFHNFCFYCFVNCLLNEIQMLLKTILFL
eukprot:GFUD01022373.1.p1 GENE.GFUD01022373.1~~GFUD01022373.1.p1  ORF type:complete len:147 (-),score=13.09 GFUD01022373.1:284-724(-)